MEFFLNTLRPIYFLYYFKIEVKEFRVIKKFMILISTVFFDNHIRLSGYHYIIVQLVNYYQSIDIK